MNPLAGTPSALSPPYGGDLRRVGPHREGGAAPSGIEIDWLFALFWRRRGLFLLVALAVLVPAAIGILSLPHLYMASARVMVEARPARMVDILPVVGALPDDRAAVLSELEVIRSPQIAREVIQALRLDQVPEFNDALRRTEAGTPSPAAGWLGGAKAVALEIIAEARRLVRSVMGTPQMLTPEQVEARVVEKLLKQLDVVSLGESRVIEVDVTARDPELAAKISNQVVEAYVRHRRELQQAGTQETNRWLKERLAGLEEDVRQAEQAVENFREQTVVGRGLDLALINQQLKELSSLTVTARAELESRRAELAKTEAAAVHATEAPSLSLFASPTFDQLRSTLADLRQQQAELTGTYGEHHPRIKALGDRIWSIQQQIHVEVQDVIAGIRTKVAIAEVELQARQADLDRLQHERIAATRAQTRLDALDRTLEAKRDVLTTFLQREQETAQFTDEQPQVRVVSSASAPPRSSQPKTFLLLAVAAMGAGLGGVGAVLVAENTRREGFLSLDEIENSYGLSVHAVVPVIDRKRMRKAGGSVVADAVAQPRSMACESLHGIALGIVGAVRTQGLPPCVLLTSAMPAEGKSSMAAGTAMALASLGFRVLVIDADPHRHRACQLLRTPGNACLADLLDDPELRPGDLVQRSPLGNLDVVAIGKGSFGLAHTLGSAVVLQAIDRLKVGYDFVLIDAPPVLPVAETRLLLALTRHCVMVVRWNHTSRKAVDHALRQVAGAGGLLSGVVLNLVDVRRMAAFDYTETHLLTDKSYRRYFNERRHA
ncbi:GumC family protein [Geminicoccus roseus]|uniref:GumC family protein n=1 Tax=Geminicoccus roseus TaxID=404900 RepID=UPI0004832D2A|nr:polysaccharide biosynthesis tyrosine autokinase [Geminicoccus roseus]